MPTLAILTKDEREYLDMFREEFGELFGNNTYFGPAADDLIARVNIAQRRLRKIRDRKRRPYSSLTQDEKREILRLRMNHITLKEVERIWGVTSRTIWEIQVENGYGYGRPLFGSLP